MDMDKLVEVDAQYREWISEVSKRFHQSQIKAAVKVNDEMLRFYWQLGKELHDRKDKFSYGQSFYKTISRDLRRELPDVKSFSETNLRYMQKFAELYSEISNLPQVGEDFRSEEIEPLFAIPWGHHKIIIDKCNGNPKKALFFVNQVIQNNWSRAVLLNFLDTDLYERQGKAITNFNLTLPAMQSDLAQEITKDPYKFDFITLTQSYNEKELKDALMDNIQKFLLELGNGFAFVGREYRIEIGSTENFIDMLFYHIRLHCYVVVEVKVTEFESSYAGQLGTYVVAVNHQLKTKKDEPTLGLLVCKSKDDIKAQYALEASSQPLGVSAYELSKLIPENFKGSLPSIDEIESELRKDTEG
ncbi:PDDEXK nuclease domain-containing protein [Agathobacter rectalis]|uniref:PDDEXK nuclease domain-containing protein n=1 Tax=Agathobacter rectalis TaxID=39491 RepID=UPI0027D339F0|nr:PDDEXK nuclease domain-containing protein [Agathobacter rectalis]MCB6952300.1 PDDEXK nuclease domain-containing protein [Agathobacter rectalis]